MQLSNVDVVPSQLKQIEIWGHTCKLLFQIATFLVNYAILTATVGRVLSTTLGPPI